MVLQDLGGSNKSKIGLVLGNISNEIKNWEGFPQTSQSHKTIDVTFDIYLFDTKYESKYLQSFKVSKNSNIRVYREFDFTYFKNQIYVPRNVKFVITRVE